MNRVMWMMVVGLGVLLTAGLGAAALGLCDYRSPETALTDARMTFAYRYYDDVGTPGVDVNAGRIGLTYDTLFDSADVGFSIVGAGEVGLVDFVPTGWLGQGAGTFRYYLTDEMPLFAFGGVDGSASPGTLGLEVRAGIGYGRFSDVTPLAKAFEIQKELLELGAIPAKLPDDVLTAVAQVIGRRVEYETIQELVADIEAAIEGASEAQLDARALLTVEEVVLRTGDRKRCGWALQGGVGYEVIDPTGGARDLVLAFSADAAFAASPDEQLLIRASFSGPFDIMDQNKLAVNAGYEYDYSNDGSIAATYTLQRVKAAGVDAATNQAASLAVSLDVGGADVVLQVSLTRNAGDPGWSIDVSVSAAMDLL